MYYALTPNPPDTYRYVTTRQIQDLMRELMFDVLKIFSSLTVEDLWGHRQADLQKLMGHGSIILLLPQ
jgi:hypothetical protein